MKINQAKLLSLTIAIIFVFGLILSSCDARPSDFNIFVLRHEENFTAYRLMNETLFRTRNNENAIESWKNRYPKENWLWVRYNRSTWVIIPRNELN